jgi:hypothetical protein
MKNISGHTALACITNAHFKESHFAASSLDSVSSMEKDWQQTGANPTTFLQLQRQRFSK